MDERHPSNQKSGSDGVRLSPRQTAPVASGSLPNTLADPLPTKDQLIAKAEQLELYEQKKWYFNPLEYSWLAAQLRELARLREDCRRWENAHKILMAENERLKQKLTDAGVDNLGDNDEYARCRSLDDQQIIREAMETPIRMVHELGNRYDVVCEQLERAAPEPAADEGLSLLRAVCQEANEYGGIAEETVQAIELYLHRAAQPPGAEQ